ncbi:hypothetical protein, partial [Piscirickettsia litoralis]|uniref:hypothetical protein n=1 Tax=Piscirickettsia litoralis TaxID=1891921 RepID=UPI001300E9E2
MTKYNPELRNISSTFTSKDWTSVSDIGDDTGLTYQEYLVAESNYVKAVLYFMVCLELNGVKLLEVSDNRSEDNLGKYLFDIDQPNRRIDEGMFVPTGQIPDYTKLALRELIWCKFDGDKQFYLHFGYDYYI